jgi:hypothetical protein
MSQNTKHDTKQTKPRRDRKLYNGGGEVKDRIEDKWLDKWDAEIMWWFYDILENELDVVMVHDSTELREMLVKARKQLLKQQREKYYKKGYEDGKKSRS